jgi:hypothetical protein
VPRREEEELCQDEIFVREEERTVPRREEEELCQDEIFVREEERTVPRPVSLAKNRKRENCAKPRQLCQAEKIMPR